ncbi:MAG: thioredoxin family protein, partial [Deltaproteobacteria bacterium]|nr:thioredoxin family protein [Deltaproteobacteria bacterium]
DPFFGREVAIYPHDTEIVVGLDAPPTLAAGERTLQAKLTWQGCSEKLCYRLEEKVLEWRVQVGVGEAPTPPATPTATPMKAGGWRELLHVPNFRDLLTHGLLIAYLLTFLGGLLTAFTPCVLPVLPVMLLIIGVHPQAHPSHGARVAPSAGKAGGASPSREHGSRGIFLRNFLLASCAAAGLALTYAALGTIGAMAGIPLGYFFQQRWFLVLLVAFYAAMALGMFGFFTIRLPQPLLQRLHRLGGAGPRGAFLAGISTGLLATPCAGPVVAALIAYVGTTGQIGFGFSLLFTYGLGFGAILLLFGAFYGTTVEHIRRPIVARVVKIVLGCLLLIPAGYYGWVLSGTTQWNGREDVAFREAAATKRPVFIEFTAKSCPPCLVLERTTLRDPAVVRALREVVVPLRIDTTFASPIVDGLLERYRVVGWPTLLFVSPEGEVYWDLTLVGEVPSPERLLERMRAAAARAKG